MKCSRCDKEVTLGKDAFWCPRLVNLNIPGNPYGDVICLDCCQEKYFKDTYRWNTKGGASGTCFTCDFPVAACLYITHTMLKQPPQRVYVLPMEQEDETWWRTESYPNSVYTYPAFRWDNDKQALEVVGRQVTPGSIQHMVFVDEKLPTRMIITPRDTLTTDSPDWNMLHRYYWAPNGKPQHFRDEEWMDEAPIVLGVSYLNRDGEPVFDKGVRETINAIKREYHEDI